MATNHLTSFRPATVPAFSSSSRKPDPNSRTSVSPNWWAPLFGFSSDPDYLTTTTGGNPPQNSAVSDPETDRSRSIICVGCFTEEKAKELRRKTLESSTFHDVMYHSAIASRLATDLSDRTKK
ncbi:hypothetical protein UlMin_017352 [Ulmus minor]